MAFIKRSPIKNDKEAEISHQVIKCSCCGGIFIPQTIKTGGVIDAISKIDLTTCPSCQNKKNTDLE